MRYGPWRDERGYIGAVAAIVLAVLLLLGSAAATLAAQHRVLAAHQYRQARAYYIAEAGVEKVLSDSAFLSRLPVDAGGTLEDDYADATVYLENAEFAGGTLSVAVTRKPDQGGLGVFRVYSTGRVGGDARVLKAEVRIPLFSFHRGIWAGGDVTVFKDSRITGNIESNGDISIKQGSAVAGDVWADKAVDLHMSTLTGDINTGGDVTIRKGWVTGGVDTEGNVSVNVDRDGGPNEEPPQEGGVTGDTRANGKVTVRHGCGGHDIYTLELDLKHAYITGHWYQVNPGVSVDVAEVPGLNLDYFRQIADRFYPETPYHGYTKTFTTKELTGINGVYFVDGNVDISGTYSGRATVVCTGNVTIRNLGRSGESDVLAVIAGKDVEVDGNAAVLVYTLKQAILRQECRVFGAIIAGEAVTFYKGSGFTCVEEMIENPPPGMGGKPYIVTWQEKYPAF